MLASRKPRSIIISSLVNDIASRLAQTPGPYGRDGAPAMNTARHSNPFDYPLSPPNVPPARSPNVKWSRKTGRAPAAQTLAQAEAPRAEPIAAPPAGRAAEGGSGVLNAAHRGVASPNSYDVGAPIYIGGGGEGYNILGMDLADSVEPYLRSHLGNFYTHKDDKAVREQILRTHRAGKPVILIGHSWGGSDAIAAARWAKGQAIPVELLITIDPVGVPRTTRRALESNDPIAKQWTTVVAKKPGMGPGDFVANLWGKTPKFVQNESNSFVTDANADHADFEKMMEYINAEQKIRDAYVGGAGR